MGGGSIVILLVFLLVLFTRRKTIFISKGKSGEIRISNILSRLPDDYHIFNDVYLNNNGYSSQIDHVIISQYGVFVIETKNYSGDVYGSENAEYWTQYLQGEGYKFRNPIKQNQSHVVAIKNVLHIASCNITPIVVFLNKVDLHCSTSSAVLYAGQLDNYILSHKEILFPKDSVERLTQRLNTVMVKDPEREQEHVKNVRQNITNRELQIANLICPRCKGRLVERQGKYGKFLGCSNYPNCKFTAKL
ncbi:MAG: NERD domain-containing protein [Bacteroidales bacterium]|nr:NERD domain-containing protein [Bacteroidales bacterium]